VSRKKSLVILFPAIGLLEKQTFCSPILSNFAFIEKEITPRRTNGFGDAQFIIGFNHGHSSIWSDKQNPGALDTLKYLEEVFQKAPAICGSLLKDPKTVFLFHDPFESMIFPGREGFLTFLTYPVLDKIHEFSEQNNIDPGRIIYLVSEGGENNKKPYYSYYEENSHKTPVKFAYYPCLEARTANWFQSQHRTIEEIPEINTGERKKKFLYLNKVPHHQRTDLCADLWFKGILDDDFHWSFLASVKEFRQGTKKRIEGKCPGFCSSIPHLLDTPYRDSTGEIVNLNPESHGNALNYMNDSYISLVSETTAGYGDHMTDQEPEKLPVFLTEKTFKCFPLKHPFVIWGYPRTLKAIKYLGYQTFSPWINEEYDEIDNYEDRMVAVREEVLRLKSMSLDEHQKMREEMMPILNHNYEHFNLSRIQKENDDLFRRILNA